MDISCTNCKKLVGKVEAVARLILTVHCPFCGQDFGAGVDPKEPAKPAPVPEGFLRVLMPGEEAQIVSDEWLPNTGKPWFGPPQ